MKRKLLYLTLLSIAVSEPSFSALTLRNGKLVDADAVATMTAENHYRIGTAAYQKKDYREASKQFNIIASNFESFPNYQDACFYLGVSLFNLKEYDLANDAFTKCLKVAGHPHYFEESLEWKFQIAEAFRGGAKKHFWGTNKLPKWAPAEDLALEIYDEIITSLPCHDLGAKALYSKGVLLWSQKDYRDSIFAFEMLVKRFPKHELTPEGYSNITKIYLEQSKSEFQNPDLIALAEVNNKKFEKEFPREERLTKSNDDLMSLKEAYAKGLFETGCFYERKKQPKASIIYYQKAVDEYPDTLFGHYSEHRLNELCPDKKSSKTKSRT